MNLDIKSLFPFPLDDFQVKAVGEIEAGKNILLTAPTGAGKTVIAEYAIHKALSTGKKLFYTSPLKALSNQKYFDLKNQFGEDKVGLLTGDTQINRNAPILVLTTEVFRNMLYQPQEDDILQDIGFLVLDECHYMKDADRGTVWEECIIYCPAGTQIIGLSATIGNAYQMSKWLDFVHGDTTLIQSFKRPVPLHHYFYGRNGMKPLTTSDGKVDKNFIKKYFKSNPNSLSRSQKNAKYLKTKINTLPPLPEIIREINKNKMLPAIYFLFSRRACDTFARKLAQTLKGELLTPEEQKSLKTELANYSLEYPWLPHHPIYNIIQNGIASHHAGLLPILKNIIERLFQKGLIKIVFATETLAAGINMPAKSTIISQISKRSDSGFRNLSASEFLQMSGRAGRRGIDIIGNVIILENAHDSILDLINILKAEPEDLMSSFMPSYTMVLNLASRMNMDHAKELVQLSFARFQKIGEIKSLQHNLKSVSDKKRKHLLRELAYLENIPWNDFANTYQALQAFGYMDADFLLTPKGNSSLNLRADHIILISEIVHAGYLQDLEPEEIAGIMTGLSSYSLRSEEQNKGWAVSQAVYQTAQSIYTLIHNISHIQEKHNINFNIPFNPFLIPIGYDWSIIENWDEFINHYDADEGDLVKIIKQASDILKHIIQMPDLNEQLKSKLIRAYHLLYRDPISS